MDRRAKDLRKIDLLLNTRGRPLSEADRGFVLVLMRELEQFQSQAPKDRALMFHPLSGYQRYLIHRVTEIYPKLSSFTIDTDDKRRTVVCFKSKRKEQQMQHGQIPPERSSSSRGTPVKEPKVPRSNSKVKSNGLSPARGRPIHSEPESRSKMGKYNTISNDAVRKRQRGLTLEGPVVNGDLAKSDVEDTRRRNRPDSRRKHRTKRSLSQPHLNDKRESRHRRDSFGGSSDNQNSDEGLNHKPRHARSATNIPDKKRTKSRKKETPSVERTEPVISRHDVDEIYQSSGAEFTNPGDHSVSDNDENEIPPSYEKMSREAKDKAMRNLMRIKRTNSTKSCPPLEQPKHNYVNSDAALLKMENHNASYHESPVFHRKHDNGEPRQSEPPSDKKTKDRSKKKKKTKHKESGAASREYVNIPKEIDRHDSYESSPFDSSWLDNPDPVNNGVKEVTAVIEKVPSLNSIIDSQVDSVANDMKELPGNLEDTKPALPISVMVPLGSMNNVVVSTYNHVNKETQTDLHGSLVDKLTSTYDASLKSAGHVILPTLSNDLTHPAKPSSNILTSGVSTPSMSSPASAYERLGEYMFKAVLNFQNMLAEGQALPQSQEFRTPNGPEGFRTTAVYPPMPHPAQPVLVPWMAPFYPDPAATRPQVLTCQSQPASTEHCCIHHQPTNSSLTKGRSRSKRGSFTSVSSRDDGSNHHKAQRSKPGSGRIPNHAVSGHLQHKSKGPDAFDSDASSEITNPELTVAEGGDGLMIYVRNSNRSTSSAAGSVAEISNNFPVASEDARASPLGHDNDDVFNKLPKPKSSNDSAARAKKKDGSKNSKLGKKSSKVDKPTPAFKNEVDPMKEIVPFSVNAPLAKMDDEWMSHSSSASSSTSRRSSFYERESESPDAEIARSLVGEDLGPLVCFDDNLEMACEDGTAED